MGLYIYGAGRVGRSLEEILVLKGYSVDAFVDINAENLHYKDYRIMRPDQIECLADTKIIVALGMENAAVYAKKSLENAGFKKVILYTDKQIQDKLCLGEGTKCVECIFVTNCQRGEQNHGKMHLNSLSVSVTTRCSLNCKHCLALIPKAKKENVVKDLNVIQFADALRVLEKYIEEIKEYSVVGGEPLLNKDICTILKLLLSSEIRFKIINILTNGTVPISEELINMLKNGKIKVTIDNYGEKLTETQRGTICSNIEMLRKNKCNYAMIDNTAGTWFDFGGFEDRRLSRTEIEERFAKCVTGGCIVLTPECYIGRCQRYMAMISIFGASIMGGNKEFVDLLNDKDMIEDKLIEITKTKTLVACNYCNGISANNIVCAGEQECWM